MALTRPSSVPFLGASAKAIFACVLAGTVFGCAQDKVSDAGATDVQAYVTQDQFQHAASIVRGLSERVGFIPFKYAADGCYARALYMSMALSANGIPSSSAFVFGRLMAHGQDGKAVQWSYHVAPLLIAGGKHYVLDPSLEPRSGVLEKGQWYARMSVGPNNRPSREEIVPGSVYPFEANNVFPREYQNVIVSRVEEMPDFKMSDVVSACGTLYDYLTREGNSSSTTLAKQRALEEQTVSFVRGLSYVGRLQGYTDGNSIYCGRRVLASTLSQPAASRQGSGLQSLSKSSAQKGPARTGARLGQCLSQRGQSSCCAGQWSWVRYQGEGYARCVPNKCTGFYDPQTFDCR